MSLLSVIAFITGVLGVWLTIRQNILCWPAALISVTASTIEFYNVRLYGDMALQVFYFFSGIYGWVFWEKNKKNMFSVSPVPTPLIPLLITATVFQAIVYYLLLSWFRGDKPVFDAILTACSLTATFMMIRKWTGNWLFWVLIDSAYVVLYGIKHMWLFSVLYLFFAAIAFYGWLKWRKEGSIKLE